MKLAIRCSHVIPIVLLLAWSLAASSQTTVVLVSDTSWHVTNTSAPNGTAVALGNAEAICLSATLPPNCPSGAVLLDPAATFGWTADLSSIPGAIWIWAPGITGANYPADLMTYWFSKTVYLPSKPLSATLSIAVDDYAEIYINGSLAGATGSVTDASAARTAQSSLAAFAIAQYLQKGANQIMIRAQNGPAGFAGCGYACPYSVNTAGVVFGATAKFSGTPSLSGAINVVSNSNGTLSLNLQLTNIGSSDALNTVLNKLAFRTLGGTGNVALLSPALPVTVGTIGVGNTITVPLTLTIPTTLMKFSVTEAGTIQDGAQNTYNFSIGQNVIP